MLLFRCDPFMMKRDILTLHVQYHDWFDRLYSVFKYQLHRKRANVYLDF